MKKRSLGRRKRHAATSVAARTWLCGFPISMNGRLAPKVERTLKESQNLTENEISTLYVVLRNSTHCCPPLEPQMTLLLRFELADRLCYLGRSEEGLREYETCFSTLDKFSDPIEAGYAWAIARRLSVCYSHGQIDEALRYADCPAVQKLLEQYDSTGVPGANATISALITLIQVRNLAFGYDNAIAFLDRQCHVLNERTIHFLDQLQLDLSCDLVRLTSGDREVRRTACRRLATGIEQLTTKTAEAAEAAANAIKGRIEKAGTRGWGLKENVEAARDIEVYCSLITQLSTGFSFLAKALCFDRKVISAEHLNTIRDRCLQFEVHLHSIRQTQGREIWNYCWLIAMVSAATGVFVTLVSPAEVKEKFAANKILPIPWENQEYVHSLPFQRRLDIFHQKVIVCELLDLDVSRHAILFAETINEWRGKIAALPFRGYLRQSLEWQVGQILSSMRRWTGSQFTGNAVRLLAAIEDVLGPARWIQEELAVRNDASDPQTPSKREQYKWRDRLSCRFKSDDYDQPNKPEYHCGPINSEPRDLEQASELAECTNPGTACASGLRDSRSVDFAVQPSLSMSGTISATWNNVWQTIFPNSGVVWQLLVDGDDLLSLVLPVDDESNIYGPLESSTVIRLPRMRRKLVELKRQHLDDKSSPFQQAQELSKAEATFHGARENLDLAVRELIAGMTELMSRQLEDSTFIDALRSKDVCFACPDPELIGLPWAMLSVDSMPLIEFVRSFATNLSVTAVTQLAKLPANCQPTVSQFDMAAYCAPVPNPNPTNLPFLDWRKLVFKSAWKTPPTSFRGLADVLDGRLDLIGNAGNVQADLETLLSYPRDGECRILLVAGHGDPHDGVAMVDGNFWQPHHEQHQVWDLRSTECLMLPSCRLGELFVEHGNMVGFIAGLLLQGIPRVLACRWVAFDAPLCSLIPAIVGEVMELASAHEKCIWSRAIRNVATKSLHQKTHRFYDIANLMFVGVS